MVKAYRCWAEIDLTALRQNLAWIRHRVGPSVRIMTVVKADAYGHGLKHIAAHLMRCGTDLFGVANLAEARQIRAVGRGWPILMLGAALPGEIAEAVREGVMATVSSWEEARAFARAARQLERPAQLHLKVDTGMGRLGVRAAEAPELARRMARLPRVQLCGLYTHFASAEHDRVATRKQQQQFEQVVRELKGHPLEYVHASNSAAVLLEKESIYNTVRPGLLVYGLLPPGPRRGSPVLRRQLQPALSWKARVSFVKDIPRGTPLSYGGSFVAPRRMRVATATVGYGDGYARAGSGRAEVLIRGQRCRVVGRITMDQMLVDVSGLPETRTNDEVVLVGREGGETITAEDLARWWGTVPWEVLTNISYRVPRVYRGSNAS